MPVEWSRLVKTFKTVDAKKQLGGEYKRAKKRAPPNLTLFPLQVAVRIVQHCEKDVDAETLQAVLTFWDKVRPVQALPDSEEEEEEGKHNDKGIRQDRPVQVLVPGGIMKREPASYLQFSTIMRGHRIIIDLTHVGDDDGGDAAANVDALQAQLADNFLAPHPPASVDSSLKRTYRLSDEHISETLKMQCISFTEWRSALWSWSRDGAPVSATTFDGNISNLLLFAGYATKHAPRAHRITPPLAFDLSVVFGSQEVLEPLVVSYLRWLRRERHVMYSTTLGYLNSLVVLANFHFADTANSSFDAGKN
jgi:hypothetical protein